MKKNKYKQKKIYFCKIILNNDKMIRNKNFTNGLGHLMIDLETMGNKSNAAIIAIGAVEFDINTGETGREFYCRVDLTSSVKVGLNIEAETVMWWLKQSDEARAEACKEGTSLTKVLFDLSIFIQSLGEVYVWGNGLRFDIGILEDAYVACGYDNMPWHPKKELDVRTLVLFEPDIKKNLEFTGNQHYAVDDCKHQIKYCSAIWIKINKIK